MSSVENRVQFDSAMIPLGRRISEIMEEKGDAFSIRAFAQRIGMSKDMLSRCLAGERYIKPSELEKIAKGLNLSIERIKQEDTQREWKELNSLTNNPRNRDRALELAIKIERLSVGVSERSIALNALGKALFNLQKYESAHNTWLMGYERAQKVAEKYGENECLYSILKNLMVSFSVRKEFSRMEEIVNQVTPYFLGNHDRMGAICYSMAMSAYERKQYDDARQKLYESLTHFENTQDAKSIGVAQSNVAFIEYKLKNYWKARELYESAIEHLRPYDYWYLIAKKDYVKSLISLRDYENAEKNIHLALEMLEKLDYKELACKFSLLLSRCRTDIDIAEKLLSGIENSKSIRQLACKFLMNHFSQVGDAQALLKYYKIAEGLSITHGDILEEDDL